jgi:hypothetical protein
MGCIKSATKRPNRPQPLSKSPSLLFLSLSKQLLLDQIAVHPRSMRCGVGASLLHHAISWSDGRSLWLTTYAHLQWNRPYYEPYGFVVIDEGECGVEIRAILQEQRTALPHPKQRIAMVRRSATIGS